MIFSTRNWKAHMKQNTQLSQDERYAISRCIRSDKSKTQLARELNRSRSTFYREINRNKGLRGYRPKQAHQHAQSRRYIQTSSFTLFACEYINHLLRNAWSPEQIASALRVRGWIDVPSHEWIYQYIYKDKANGGDIYKCLRSQKTYRKRGFKNNDRRGQLANRTSIHCRPKEIDQRERLGDFEGDTVIGKNHKGAILTLVDRKSLYVHIVHLGATRQSKHTISQCIERLKLSHAYSVTFDNGKEFSEHERITDRGIAAYFADPYKSIQRAKNENTNGLIRQFLPKSSSFEHVTVAQIREIEDNLNNRPRKSLGWCTPNEIMAGYLTVALAS